MSEIIVPKEVAIRPDRSIGVSGGLFRGIVVRKLRGLKHGRVILVDGSRTNGFGEATDQCSLRATVTVHDRRFYRRVVLGGTLGVADAFIHGWWSCDDLTALIRIFIRNMETADGMEAGVARLGALAARLYHRLKSNTRNGSRRNIHAHYDLGNEFFRLFLDSTLAYSCGIFADAATTLEAASIAKFERICLRLDLAPSDHLLEIGTGWGGFAIHAAKRYGCRVTTTTISTEQFELARRRIADEGLADRVEVRRDDYRDLHGTYDKLVSIEMIEAVGHDYLDTFFHKCSDLLKPDGVMALQAITMSDQRYDQYLRSVDFIRRYVFPGSCVPSFNAMSGSVARATDMRITHLEDIGLHYAQTIRQWRRRFHERLGDVRAMGLPESFIRLWTFYLCYCEAGFDERYISNVQILLSKPRARCGLNLASNDLDQP